MGKSNYPKVWISTRNPCNEFIVDHLLKIKIAAKKSGNDRKNAIYGSAIMSIKRYPLPLICRTQVTNLNGIGDYIG